MKHSVKRLFIYGFPALYGGAGTELHHQIIAWEHMGMDIHLIPTNSGYKQEPLYKEMIERGVTVHEMNEWEAIEAGDPVLGFCNAEFLEHLPKIHARTRRTIFTNCMTWLFDKEKERMTEGMIGMFLYQNEAVRQKNMPELQGLNDDPEIRYTTFKPYFENTLFPFIKERSEEHFGCGRISRMDADKFAKQTLHIYEYFVSPKFKKGYFSVMTTGLKRKSASPSTGSLWLPTKLSVHSRISTNTVKSFYNLLAPLKDVSLAGREIVLVGNTLKNSLCRSVREPDTVQDQNGDWSGDVLIGACLQYAPT
jgi:hypothetical protein